MVSTSNYIYLQSFLKKFLHSALYFTCYIAWFYFLAKTRTFTVDPTRAQFAVFTLYCSGEYFSCTSRTPIHRHFKLSAVAEWDAGCRHSLRTYPSACLNVTMVSLFKRLQRRLTRCLTGALKLSATLTCTSCPTWQKWVFRIGRHVGPSLRHRRLLYRLCRIILIR
jgi:hypothetical protein